MDILRWIFGLIVTVAAIVFAVANRGEVSIVWSPLNNPVALPVYALVLASVVTGFLAGGFLGWLDAGVHRRESRRQRRKLSRLERSLGAADDNVF